MFRLLEMRTAALLLTSLLFCTTAPAEPLHDSLGRTEVLIVSEPYPLVAGRSAKQMQLEERLQRLDYKRVKTKPTQPGQYFWGREVFWIYRRGHRAQGREWAPMLIGLRLGTGGTVVTAVNDKDQVILLDGRRGRWLEPEVLAESIEGDRAERIIIELDELPVHVWRPLLALEDHRFFNHIGVDGKAIARAAWQAAKDGKVTQGGSTITQQLIKNRDLTSKRTLDRKASEAVRALAYEAEYTKEEILEGYFNTVYYGHVDGVAIHGLGTAAHVFYSKEAKDLTLDEAAVLAAVLQGPNGLSPIRHPDKAKERRDRAIRRMVEEQWLTQSQADAATAKPIRLNRSTPQRRGGHHLRRAVVADVKDSSDRVDRGLGFRAETTIDPLLQAHADDVVAKHLAAIRRNNKRLRTDDLQAALVAIDVRTGTVIAHVGGDPKHPDSFDRVTEARRQPGSAVKPFVLLEALDSCGSNRPLHMASRISDSPYTVEIEGTTWRPNNYDGKNHGVVSARRALKKSYNRPFARMSQYCGLDATANRFEKAGLPVPDEVPLSLPLGAIEVSPLELATAYTAFVDLGVVTKPITVTRIERPSGKKLDRARPSSTTLSRPSSAWLVRDGLLDVVDGGTGKGARVKGQQVLGKTGTSSKGRDAWFVGASDGVVVAVWVGLDKGNLGLTGGAAAAPIFRDFMTVAGPARPDVDVVKPPDIVDKFVDPSTGLLVFEGNDAARAESFRRSAQPRRDIPLLVDEPGPVID